jgi:hypothetical protein
VGVARDTAGQVFDFDKALLETETPIQPGESGQVWLSWPSASPEVARSRVELIPLSLEGQRLRPVVSPCARAPVELALPYASQP